TEAEPSPGEAEAADTGSDAAAARPTEEEGVVTASGNGLEQHGARQRLLIVGVLAAVLAVALGGVLAVRRRSRG
ncbi:MAG: hypothetical protein ACE5JM_14395, partial [Armatimonadota bacterium]